MNFSDLTKIKTTDFADKSFKCSCGRTHTVGTKKIIIGENAIATLKDVLKSIMPAGKVLFLSQENTAVYNSEILKILGGCGYTVEKKIFSKDIKADISCGGELLRLGDDIRLAVAFGSGEICDIAKHYGVLSGNSVVFMPSAPSNCFYLSAYSSLYVNGIKQDIITAPVTALICDLEIMAEAAENHRAAGFGEVCSFITALTDRYFEKCITGCYSCENITSMIKQSINICIDEGEGLIKGNKKSIYALTDALMRCSLCMQLLYDDFKGGEHQAADLLFPLKKDLKPLLYGEITFIAQRYILGLYNLFFTSKFADVLLPPDKGLHAQKLAVLLNCDENYILSKMNYDLSPDTYRVRGYKTEEYRSDFTNAVKLAQEKNDTAWVIFKRMYADAGYWIDGVIKDKELKTAVALGADLSDRYTVLAHMRNAGLFEQYLK